MKYWNDRLKNMTEYIPGEQPQDNGDIIKLNTNENAFPPAPSALEALKKACNDNLRFYPDASAMSLRELFAEQHDLDRDNVFVGNGSDEIFTLLFRGFVGPDETAAFAYPSYSLYYTLAEANGISYKKHDLNDELDVDFNKFLNKEYRLVIIANPNNPTGKGCHREDVRAFLREFKGLLIIDEAYVDFYGETVLDLIREFDNLVVTRSFSKSYSLAGLRVGLALAQKDIISGFLKLKDSYNVDRLAEAGAMAALIDQKNFKYNVNMIRSNKEYLEESLEAMEFTVVPSKANFLFVKHTSIPSETIFEKLRERKIYVRHFKGPIQEEYLRITIGTMMQLKKLMEELSVIITGE